MNPSTRETLRMGILDSDQGENPFERPVNHHREDLVWSQLVDYLAQEITNEWYCFVLTRTICDRRKLSIPSTPRITLMTDFLVVNCHPSDMRVPPTFFCNPVYARHVDSSALVFNLSSHRYSFLRLFFNIRGFRLDMFSSSSLLSVSEIIF